MEWKEICQPHTATHKTENPYLTQFDSAVIHLQTRNNFVSLSQETGTKRWKLDEVHWPGMDTEEVRLVDNLSASDLKLQKHSAYKRTCQVAEGTNKNKPLFF